MPGVLSPVAYEPIRAWRVLSQQGALPAGFRFPEAATQTFLLGVPLRFVSGYLQECTFSAADVVAGISQEHAHNLAVAGTAQDLSEAAPQNQPSGITTPIGAWIRDGNCGLWAANGQTVFTASLKAGQTYTAALLVPGTYYALVKDATSGFWYIDNGTTAGNAAVCQLLGMDPTSPNDGVNGTRVQFQFKSSQRLFQ